MDLFSNLQLLHEAAISVLVTTTYGRWRTITVMNVIFSPSRNFSQELVRVDEICGGGGGGDHHYHPHPHHHPQMKINLQSS